MATKPSDLLSRGFFPDHTQLQERILVTPADVIVGDRCWIDFGLNGEDVAICEFSTVKGDITAHGDLRIDNFCEIIGDVTAEQDAYLGEGVKIRGKLTVLGDMDIGDNVQLNQGFEARGWISIRNPMPVILYIFLYLMALLHLEREEEVEKFLSQITAEEVDPSTPLLIPPRSVFNIGAISIPAPLSIGAHSRFHGTISAESIDVGEYTSIFGSLRAAGSIKIGGNTEVHGEVVSGERVSIDHGALVLGNVFAPTLEMEEDARVEGLIRAPEGLRIRRKE